MIKSVSREQLRSVRHRLNHLYGGEAERLLERFFMMIGRYGVGGIETATPGEIWSEKDSVLITYADSIQSPQQGTPLRALESFAQEHLKALFVRFTCYRFTHGRRMTVSQLLITVQLKRVPAIGRMLSISARNLI